jgi:hypothetical protein
MAINDATIAKDVFISIRTKLVAGLSGISVNAAYNDKNNSKGQVVITPAFVNEDFDKFGGTEGKKAITVLLTIYAVSPLTMDEITDQVRVLIKQNDISGIDLIGIDEDYAFNLSNSEDKLHSKSLSCGFMRE